MRWFQGYNNVLPTHINIATLTSNDSLSPHLLYLYNLLARYNKFPYNQAATPIIPAANPKVTPFALAAPVDFAASAAEPVADPVPLTEAVRLALPLPPEAVATAVGISVMVTPSLAQMAATAGASSEYLVSYRPM